LRFTPSKPARFKTALPELLPGAARAEVIPPEFLFEQLVSVDDADSAFDAGLGGKSFAALAHRLEKNGRSSKLAVDMAHHPF